MKKIIILATLFLMSTIIGCGGSGQDGKDSQYHKDERAKSKTIVSVGESEIKLFLLDEYNQLYKMNFQNAEEEYNSKKEYLDTLINLFIFVEAAYDQALDKDPEVQRIIKESRPDFLRDELFKLKILPFLEVTDEEVDFCYEQMHKETKISIIYVLDSVLTDSIYNMLKNGGDFAALARKYSEDQASAVKGGDLGFRQWLSLSEDFQNEIFDLEIGEIVVLDEPQGWNIATVTDRREVEVDPLDPIRDALISRIQGSKRTKVQDEFYSEIFENADIKINEETTEFILDKVEALYPDVIGGVPFRKNTFNPDDLAQYERNMPLAIYNGGEVLLGDYLTRTATWEDRNRPPFNETENLRMAVFNLQLLDILENRAIELKLDETDDYKDGARFFKDQLMAARMKEIITREKSFVSDEEVIDYFETNSAEYTIPKKLHVQEINVATQDEADRIYAKLEKNEDFGQLAEKNTMRPAMKSKKGDLGFIADYNYPTLYSQALRLHVDSYSKPFPVGDGWSIVKLLDIRDGRQKQFEEVARQLKTELENKKRETAVSEWMTENIGKYKVKKDYDLIWKTIDKGAYE
jgi:parvulin-like peptidyl-prolyl isomerase